MIRFRNSLPLALAVLVGVAMLALASPARAGFTITLHETGFADQSFNLTSGALNTVGPTTFGDYTVTVTARDSAPGIDQTFGGALVSQNTFTVTSAASAPTALRITVQDDTFSSAPYGSGNPVTLQNSLSTTLITSGTVAAHGFIMGGSTVTTNDISLNGPNLGGSVSNSASGSISPLGPTFTLGNVALVTFTSGGTILNPQQANFTVTTLAPVPEPSTMAVALTGLPLVIGVWMRRRRQMA